MRVGIRCRVLVAVWIGGALCAPLTVLADGVAETGSGDMVREQLDLRGFSALQVAGSWEVEAAPGAFAVEVEVDDNVRDDVRVELRGNTLRFGLRQGARWFRRVSLRARVSLPELERVQVSGSGRVAAHGFEATTLELGVSGSGRVHANGCRVGALEADLSGSGDITVEGCELAGATISISGSGDVFILGEAAGCRGDGVSVRISGSGSADLRGCTFTGAEVRIGGSGDGLLTLGSGDLTGSISGSGTIRYRGSPTRVDVRTSGSGRVIKEG